MNEKEKILVFWQEPIPAFLPDYFVESNIHLSLCEFSENAIQRINKNYDGILILCELNRNDKNESINMRDLYGIKLAQSLRLKGITAPILFTSFLSRKQVYNNKPEREIINTIGHDFIQLPVHINKFIGSVKKIKPLTDLELYDIQNSYCRKDGMIRELTHRLSNIKYFDFKIKSKEEIKLDIEKAVYSIADLYNENPNIFLNGLWNKHCEVNEKNINEVISKIGAYGEDIIREKSPVSISDVTSNNKRWELLWLDDEASSDHKLMSYLKEKHVKAILCSSGEVAVKYLEEDFRKDNKVGVVLTDYRLYEIVNEVKVHQKIQGYTFLKNIADSGKMIRLAALSALPRKFLLHSFKNFNIRTEIFSKRDYLEDDNTIRVLCDELIEIGNENEEAILRLPRITSEYWKFFEPFYAYHRNSNDYYNNENYISEKSKIYCEGLIQNDHEYKFQLTGYTVALGRDMPTTEAREKNNSKLKDQKRKGGKKYSIEEKLSTYKDPSKGKYFDEFINKMICRRVAIWYTQHNPSYSLRDVHRILKGKNYLGTETDLAAKNQINTNLALKLSEFPWNMTIEEKNWLVYEMKMIGINEKEKQEDTLLAFFSNQIVGWLEQHEEFSKLFSNKRINTFGEVRKILNQVAVNIHEHLGILDSLLSLVTACKTEIYKIAPAEEYRTETVLSFEKYLELLVNRLRRIKKLPVISSLASDDWEELKSRITKEALKKLTSINDRQTLESIAWLFFYELKENNKTFSNDNIYLSELFKEFNKQKFINPYIVGDDDLKIYPQS